MHRFWNTKSNSEGGRVLLTEHVRACFWLQEVQWLSSNGLVLSFGPEFASKLDLCFALFHLFSSLVLDDSAASSPWTRVLSLVYVCCNVLGQLLWTESLYINAWSFDLILHWKLSNFAKNPIFLHMECLIRVWSCHWWWLGPENRKRSHVIKFCDFIWFKLI